MRLVFLSSLAIVTFAQTPSPAPPGTASATVQIDTPNSPVQRAVPSDPNSAIISGYGFINLNGGAGAVPRSGQMVARFTV
jgi:hypothetical protein